jgi:hypothetical protein
MKLLARSLALVVAVSFLLGGPLAPLAAAQQQPPMMQDQMKTGQPDDTNAYDVGAGIANIAYVPGKALVCGAGVLVGGVLMLLTLGTAYKAAAATGEDGCGGKWVLRGDDLRPSRMTEDQERPSQY